MELKSYYLQLPNIVLEINLNPYELTLYVHIKRVTGENGECFQSRSTIAKQTGMSEGMVSKVRRSLERPRLELDGQPLILTSCIRSKSGGKKCCRIRINDIWSINKARFSSSDECHISTSHHDVTGSSTSLADDPLFPDNSFKSPHDVSPSRHDLAPSSDDASPSPHDPKEEPSKNTQRRRTNKKIESSNGSRIPTDFSLTPELRIWATKNAANITNLDDEFEQFVDYWRGVPGSRGLKADWSATLRNWLRRRQSDYESNANDRIRTDRRESASNRFASVH